MTTAQTLTAWGMFWEADWVIKFIIISLVFSSIWSWAIIIQKIRKIYFLNTVADQFEEIFYSTHQIEDFYRQVKGSCFDPMSRIFSIAMEEWLLAKERKILKESLGPRIERLMYLVMSKEMTALDRYMGFLSSLGANGMIVGLLGTVLGIMNSFSAIAFQKTANLSVVAPGIAEALFATAIGLLAALPAAIAFNKISKEIQRYGARLEHLANEIVSLVSRKVDEEVVCLKSVSA